MEEVRIYFHVIDQDGTDVDVAEISYGNDLQLGVFSTVSTGARGNADVDIPFNPSFFEPWSATATAVKDGVLYKGVVKFVPYNSGTLITIVLLPQPEVQPIMPAAVL